MLGLTLAEDKNMHLYIKGDKNLSFNNWAEYQK